MLKKNLLSAKDKLIQENGLLKFVVVVFGAASIISSTMAYHAKNHTRTIVTPSNMDRQYEVTNNWMDNDGIKMFTRNTLDLRLNYTKDTADDRFHDLMQVVLVKKYSKVKEELTDQLRTIDRLNIVSYFNPESYIIDRKKNIVSAIGLRRKEANGQLIFDGSERWNIYFEIVEANFKILAITKSTNIRKVADAKTY